MSNAAEDRLPRRGGMPRGLARHGPAVLSYGFRPFFLGAGLWALIVMCAWIGALVWGWEPGGSYGVLNWHAHEMLFGYTGAALAGFMLTAIPNWTGRLPVSGTPLLLLVLLWAAGRAVMAFPEAIGSVAAIGIDALFFPALGLVAAREITAGKNWRNLHVVVALTVLSVANIWFHWRAVGGEDTGIPYRLTISVWVMLISLIGGRLAVSFTRNWLSRRGATRFPASPGRFDRATLIVAGLALAIWVIWPQGALTGMACFLAAALHLVRLSRWRGRAAWREPLVLILHVAYGFIPLGFAAIGAAAFGVFETVAALHLLTVGAVGCMTLAVMTRATRGHTGRPLAASAFTTLAYIALVGAALLRPAVEVFPAAYSQILDASGLLWLAAYALFVAEYGPMLLRPRLDAGGKG